jgi:DNA ligase-1
MSKPFKPMLAADISEDLDKLRFPLYATPKLDGVRALVFADGVYSRSMKKIPNRFVQAAFGQERLRGFDGELIVGSPTAGDVYRKTNSVVASHDDETSVDFYYFDKFSSAESYEERFALRTFTFGQVGNLVRVPQTFVRNERELLAVEAKFVDLGYEGLILRSLDGVYKNGRSTIREQGMLKLKRFVDSEAEVIGVEEEMHNANAAKVNELGHTARSSHKAGLVGKGTMGALCVRDIRSGVEFRIGTGFTAADRARSWINGTIVKYKSFPVGVKDKPRHPVYLGIREDFDL